jgi:dolichol-phosphate mannosyltransferase
MIMDHSGDESLELAIVIPTFKERDNVVPLLERLAKTLVDVPYEVIFVDDDSPDGTADLVRSIALRNSRIRVLHRIKRRGLSSACLEGMQATAAPYIAVMDADLQHDETILPAMLSKIQAENLDLVVGTRNGVGGSMGEFAESRVKLSNLGRRLSKYVSRCDLSDPMSGFFVLRRPFLREVVHATSGIGFKILLDLVASSPRPVQVGEVPYRFSQRIHGDSKLDILVGLEYLKLLLDKLIGQYVPVNFLLFALVGAGGAVLHLACLYLLFRVMGIAFMPAQAIATVVGMTVNFFANNAITYRELRLRGLRMLGGLASFYVACSIGAVINLRLAAFLLEQGLLSWLWAGLVGVTIGSVWNYAVTAVFTWRRRQVRMRRSL